MIDYNRITLPPIISDMLRVVLDPNANMNYRENVALRLADVVDISQKALAEFYRDRDEKSRNRKRRP